MKPTTFAFIDTETTGLNAERHEIIEVAGIIVRITNPADSASYEVLDQFEYRIKPERIGDADPLSLKINHYDPSAWGDALPLEEVMHRIGEKTEGAVMVGHNVAFDAGFLEKAFQKTGILNRMHYHKLDTISMAYALLHGNKEVDHLSLRALCDYFEIEQSAQHEALADVQATLALYKKLMSL